MADFSLLLGPQTLAHRAEVSGEQRVHALVQAHLDFIWRLLCRLGIPEGDADDCAQQVFIVASRRLDDISPEHERTFLYGTALRVASTFRRDERRARRLVEPAAADAASTAPTPHEELEQRQALQFLDEVLAQLDAELRAVFVLCVIEELSGSAVAEITGLPTGTVASRLRRARQKFDEHARRLQAQRVRTR